MTFCIQDMHKEEFYSTLLEDRFISFLIRQIKNSAKDGNMEEILKLIENLEHDSFPNSPSKQTKKANGKEMTRFSSFLDLQLKEIVERQNALEKQILTLKANNDINTLNNLNNLINEKVEEIYSKSEIPYTKSPDESTTKINSNISHSIIKECNHHFHSHSDNSNTLNVNNENYAKNEKNVNNTNRKEISQNNNNNNGNTNTNTNTTKITSNHISKNMLGNFNKNENYSTIDELVNYIETNDSENKQKKNKKKLKSSKKKTQQNKSPSVSKNQRTIEESVVENFKNKIYNESSMAYQIRKVKPSLSVKWLKSINNI